MSKHIKIKSEEDNVEVTIEKKPGCIATLLVNASPSLVEKARKQAIKLVNKEITIPGFRKGKAPENLILKQYASSVEKKWQKSIADLSFIAAQKKTKIYPLNSSTSINFDLKKHSLKEGAELSFSYETEPTIPPIDVQNFKLKEIKKTKVDEKKVNEALRQARFFSAKWTEVERPIKENDYVILDLEAIDKEPFFKVFSDTRFEVTDKSIAQWMKKLLIGAKKGDVIKGISTPDDTLSAEEKKKFESKKVRITIKKVEEAVLPELNDDFAKKMGVKNVDELKKNIKNLLEKQANDHKLNEEKAQVNKFLVENNKIDLPSSLIKSETKYRRDKKLSDAAFKKKFEKLSKIEKEKIEKDLEKQAYEAITLFYLSRKIIDDEKISITQKEVHDEITKTIKMNTPLDKEPNLKNISKQLYAMCLSQIIMEKAQNYVLSKSTNNVKKNADSTKKSTSNTKKETNNTKKVDT